MPEQFDSINNQTHEILQKIPKWYIRFGSMLLFVVFIGITLLITKISYPTYLNASGIIKTYDNAKSFYFITKVPQKYFTQLTKGTSYKVTLESYPSNTFGTIIPLIDSVLPLSNEDMNFTICSIIDKKALSGCCKNIVLLNNLSGNATFIIEEKTIFSQLFK